MSRLGLAVVFVSLAACQTIEAQIGVPGGRTLHASVTTGDGATIELWRWSPTTVEAPKVLVLPELGFDHRLVASLCARLRDRGFDVATLDSREVTGKAGRRVGLPGWELDVARAVAVHGPKPLVVAIGLGGDVEWMLAQEGAISGLVAINVPFRQDGDNVTLRKLMLSYGYDPRLWMRSRLGSIALAAGHDTPVPVVIDLKHLARSVSAELAADVAESMLSAALPAVPTIPTTILLSPKDNLVASEDAFPLELIRLPARRLARMEWFNRDYGHLDWLVDDTALDEITPVISSDLERMR